VAGRLAVAGKPVSRRALRSGGIRGSNEALNKLARELNAERTSATAPPPGGSDHVEETTSHMAGRRDFPRIGTMGSDPARLTEMAGPD